MSYVDYGNAVTLGIEVRNAAGVLANAASNTLTILLPDGSTVAPSTTNDSTGVYSCAYQPVQSGNHQWSWVTTTPATGESGSFDVAPQFPGLIVSLAEAKDFLDIDDSDEDDLLRGMLEGITAVVEDGDGKSFAGVGPVVRRTVTTRIPGDGREGYMLPYTAIVSLTSGAYVSDASAVTLTSYTFTDGILRPAYGGRLPSADWTLTYVVGRPDLPANIRMGALEILREAWDSQRGSREIPSAYLIPYRAQAWLGGDSQALGFA